MRSWTGWRRHVTLSLLAHAVLAAVRKLADEPPQKSRRAGPELIPLSSPEVRRLLVRLLWGRLPEPSEVLGWSEWRRAHQAFARRCHYRKRDAEPPD